MCCDIMEMRNVLGNSQPRQGIAYNTVGVVSRNDTKDVHVSTGYHMEHRSATNAVDSDAVNEIGAAKLLPRTDISREEAESIGGNSRKTKPSDLRADIDELALWHECYGDLWNLKLAFEKQHRR